MFYCGILAISLAIAGMSSAHAASQSDDPFPMDAYSTDEFREQATVLRSEMDTGKYRQLPNGDKKSIGKRLDQLDAFYVKRSTGENLTDDESAALVNASSEINALLKGDEREKLVCEQVKILGSNRRNKVCMSVADRDERRRADTIRMQDQNLTGRKFREQ